MYRLDWSDLDHSFPYVEAMRNCVQDTVYHAEGDVWTHTRRVLGHLTEDHVMRLTGLFHDVAKPETRTVVFDQRERISHPHHARKGAQIAWNDLYLMGEALPTRLEVYWRCLWHQKVFHMWDNSDMIKAALQYACVADWPGLIAFARADNAGRITADPQIAEDNLVLLQEWLSEQRLDFQTEHDRLFYFERDNRYHDYHPPQPQGSRVVVLSGLPGVGKDHYAKTRFPDLPVISMDAIRARLKVDPADDQGTVVQTATEEARVFLRKKAPFIWNATCLTKLSRGKIIRLCRDYDAHVSIHGLDRPLEIILRQNRERERNVPEQVIRAMIAKWEPPSLLEAHQVIWA